MLNANELLQEAIEQVKSIGIVPGKINAKVELNTTAKRFGRCSKVIHKDYDYEIQINKKLLSVDKSKLMSTLVHEVLHSCKGCMNHGSVWKNYAAMMNFQFGYDISRTSSYEAIGIERPVAKYTIECQGCGNKFHRQNKSKLITHTSQYKCKCGSGLKLI